MYLLYFIEFLGYVVWLITITLFILNFFLRRNGKSHYGDLFVANNTEVENHLIHLNYEKTTK